VHENLIVSYHIISYHIIHHNWQTTSIRFADVAVRVAAGNVAIGRVGQHAYAHVGRVGFGGLPLAIRRRVPVDPVTVVGRRRSRLEQSNPVVAAAGTSAQRHGICLLSSPVYTVSRKTKPPYFCR